MITLEEYKQLGYLLKKVSRDNLQNINKKNNKKEIKLDNYLNLTRDLLEEKMIKEHPNLLTIDNKNKFDDFINIFYGEVKQ